MSGVGRLLAGRLRRDRVLLPIWILGIALLGLAVGSAIATEFGQAEDRAAIIALASANPAFLFLRGLPDGTSIGAVAFFQAFSFTAVLAGLMNTFLVVRHTRADEELGRMELVGSTPVSRSSALVATIALGITANVALVVAVAAGYILGGLPVEGAVVAAIAVGAVGLFFVGVGAVVVQLMPSGRASNGAAASIVGAAYLVRGIGDALGTTSADFTRTTPSWLSGLSPIGWGQATRPFSEPTLLPLVASIVGFAVLCGFALWLQHSRDLGSSLVAERGGRATARIGGRSALGLAIRTQRSSLIGWCIGVAVLGSIAGGLAPVVADAVESNASLAELIGSLVPGSSLDIVEVFIAALLGMAGILAAAAGVQAVLRLRSEEAEGRAELLLSTPVSRARWLASTLVVSAGSVIVVCAVAGAATGVAMVKSSGDPGDLVRLTGAALAHAPAALVFVAVTALLFAVLPQLTVALGWGLLVLGLVIGQFGELLKLPEWLQNASPFHHSSAVPAEALDTGAALVLLAIAIAGSAVATVVIRGRDLTA